MTQREMAHNLIDDMSSEQVQAFINSHTIEGSIIQSSVDEDNDENLCHRLTVSELEFIVERVLSNAADAVEEDDKSEFLAGKKLAYYEILDTIKNELTARDVNLQPSGLDIILEKLL